MIFGQGNAVQRLQGATTDRAFFRETVAAANSLGFRYCAYVMRVPFPLDKPHTEMFSNYPRAWQERYRQRNYLALDPAVRHGVRSTLPMTWAEPHPAPKEKFWKEASASGLRFGWVQSCRSADNTLGVLILAREQAEVTADELGEKGPLMSWLAQMTHLEMSRRVLQRLMPNLRIELSPREVTILRMMAEGLTIQEAADRSGITHRTAKYYVNRCCVKLHAPNKTAAAIRAALLGLI
jgi:LuxR family transcriptional regulator